MINTPLILQSNKKEALRKTEADLPFVLAIELKNIDSLNNIPLKLIHQSDFFSENCKHFSFYININTAEEHENLKKNHHYLLQYLFHPKFLIQNNSVVLFSNASNYSVSFINDFNEKIKAQGYDFIKHIILSDIATENENNHVLLKSGNKPEIIYEYSNLLKFKYYSGKYIAIKENSELINYIQEAESILKQENFTLYNLLLQQAELKNEYEKLQQQHRHLAFDLENHKTYLSFYKNNDEAEKINNFYHYEYEILPLWYKKLGHLIKVLMGKRKFRSLFDNNVKKYKD